MRRWLMLSSPLPRANLRPGQPIPTPKMKFNHCREGQLVQYDHIVLTLDGQLITEESEGISTALGRLL